LTAVCSVFLGDAPRSGAFFTAFLVFLAAVVFLRVDTLTAAFLRFALVAFFRVATTASLVSSWIPVAESLPKRSRSPGKEEYDTKADIGESGPDPFQEIVVDDCLSGHTWPPDVISVRTGRGYFFMSAHLLCSSGCTASFAAMVLKTL
jgi:hypothetical protein